MRTERLFREDIIMLYSIIPLMIRMALVHVVLIWGTNNTVTFGLSPDEILHRTIGSKLVLASRIFYATFIWVAKLTVLEFLKRTVGAAWAKSYEIGLRLIYGFLAVTYISVVIATLVECHPFYQYWQVIPDPGPQCREGLVQLMAMGVCDIVTDIVLIVFPIPLVVRSSMRVRKKISLILLFLTSIILIAITSYRIPSTMDRRSSQQYRSLLASLEILAAAFVSNSVVIGSFIRDKGVKKAKFKADSIVEDSNSLSRAPTRTKSVALNHWGSDEDLVRDIGVALPTSLRRAQTETPRVAPVAMPDDNSGAENESPHPRRSTINSRTPINRITPPIKRRDSDDSMSDASADIKLHDLELQTEESHGEPTTPGKMNFFDVGGLIDNPLSETTSGTSREASIRGNNDPSSQNSTTSRTKSSSRAFLADVGGLLTRHREEGESSSSSPSGRLEIGERSVQSPRRRSPNPTPLKKQSPQVVPDEGPNSLSFTDVGGLLKL